MWKKTMGQLTHADYTEFTGYEPSSVIVFLKPRRKTRYWLCLNDVVKKKIQIMTIKKNYSAWLRGWFGQ